MVYIYPSIPFSAELIQKCLFSSSRKIYIKSSSSPPYHWLNTNSILQMLEKFAHPHAHRLQGIEKERAFSVAAAICAVSAKYICTSTANTHTKCEVKLVLNLRQENKITIEMKRRRRVGEFPQWRKFDTPSIY
jgi:hypothetical protein